MATRDTSLLKNPNAAAAPSTRRWRWNRAGACRRSLCKELMDRVADDCQFTKDLAACAIATMHWANKTARGLLQTAEDYCMSGDEQVALAEASSRYGRQAARWCV